MAPSGSHGEMRERLGAYALGDDDPAERAEVQDHLEGCPACRAELAELLPLRDRLAGVHPDRLAELPVPPPGLRDAVLSRVAAESTGGPEVSARRRGLAGLVAAAVLTGLVGGYAAGWLTRPAVEDLPEETVAVQVVDADITASADVVPHSWGVEVQMVGAGFTAGERYSVSVRRADGAPEPAGAFLGVGRGELVCNLNSAVLRQDATGFEVLDSDGDVVVRSDFPASG